MAKKRKSYVIVGTGARSAMFIHGHNEDFNMPGMRELEGKKETLVPEIIFQPLWGKQQLIDYQQGNLGGNGGGDVRLLNDIFLGVKDNSLGHAAGMIDGVKSLCFFQCML